MPPPLSITALYPDTHWHDLKIMCNRIEYPPGVELTTGHGGGSQWGDGTRWKCSVGTLIIDSAIAPCTPCQKIEYTCRDTGAQVFRKTFCPVGAKYPDRRLNLMGDQLPAEGSEEDEITVPKKSCSQIKQETIRFISALWQKDCDIKTNGELRDLLNEAGPHCGTVRYSCPTAKGQPQRKEWNFCARQMGTWERSMRQFLMGLSPTCTVEGDGKTALWWKYYQGIVNNVPLETVYSSDLPEDSITTIFAEHLAWEYRWQKGPWSIVRYPPDEYAYERPAFSRNNVSVPSVTPWPWSTMKAALKAVCSPIAIEGGLVENTTNAVEGKEQWAEGVAVHAALTLLCPALELSR